MCQVAHVRLVDVASDKPAHGAAGYHIRRSLVAALQIKDPFIALLEDLVAIELAFFFVTR